VSNDTGCGDSNLTDLVFHVHTQSHLLRSLVIKALISDWTAIGLLSSLIAFGAFTRVSYGTPQNLKNILGHQAYVIEAVRSFINY